MFRRGSVAAGLAAGLVLATGGCGGGADEKDGAPDKGSGKGPAGPARTGPPSEELVEWVGDMCESTTALETARKDSSAGLKEIRNPDEADPPVEHLAFRYIARTPWPVESVERDLKYLDPSGIPAADRLLDAWRKKLKRVVSGLDKISPGEATGNPEDAEGIAADVDELVQSLTAPQPDLPALTKKHPLLASAHKRAEQCAPGWKPPEETASPAPDPSGPLPKAADGKNTGACADGECEVLVTSEASITANGLAVDVSVANESVTFRSPSGVIQLGGGSGVARFGDELTINVVAQNEDGAVLKFTAS